jgi:2'-5' RNA ligase
MATPSGRFAILLSLDTAAVEAVRELSRHLDIAPPRDATRGPPPHVTLAGCTGLDLARFRPLAAEVAAATGPLECTLAGLGVFPTAEGVLYLAPAITSELVQLQLVVVERLRQTGATIEPYWTHGQWVPHCTLAIGMPREAVASALGHAFTEFQPITGQLVRLSVYSIDPPEFCYEFPLAAA